MTKGFFHLFGRMPREEDLDELRFQHAYEGNFVKIMHEANLTYPDSSTQQLVKSILYDEVWGIDVNHEHDLSPVLVHKPEVLYDKNTMLRQRLDDFILNEVRQYTGLTFNEYLELPRCEQQIILEGCRDHVEKKRRKEDSQRQEQDKVMEQLGLNEKI